jgi:hypothetical protein
MVVSEKYSTGKVRGLARRERIKLLHHTIPWLVFDIPVTISN